ncbi:hybrid sensor histidine kinase/response regulator [Peribacillus glennii]|uniref:histidine kinase n=1 Tax=Peribacillus glennii TaxID=2303991 RepID=A0A372LDG8_9BACI|nr:ATP-binding protein [Peribacillus glennii]RFU63716.1 response regulator [Peribacillus glennii]
MRRYGDVKQLDPSDIGLVFKFVKEGERFIHTFCEGGLLSKMGFTPADILGRVLDDFEEKSVAKQKLVFYQQAWAGKNVQYESTINEVNYVASLMPVVQNGSVIEVMASCIDISDKKNLLAENRQKENLYGSVLNTMSEGIFIMGKDKRVETLNENVGRILGVNLSGIYDQPTLKERYGVEFVTEDGKPLSYDQLPGVETYEKGISFSDVVLGVKEKNLNIKWISVNATPLPITLDQETAALISIKDITLQKEQETRLLESHSFQKNLLDILDNGIIASDRNRNITLMNQRAHEMFGLKEDVEFYIGKHITYLHSFFSAASTVEVVKKREKASIQIETLAGRIIQCNYFPFRTNKNAIANLWELQDITERKIMERSILLSKEEAEKANFAKSDFLSKMSHELRTPLNGILGFAQLLEMDRTLQDKHLDFVQEILNSGRHLLNLINEMLDLSRIETGKLKVFCDKTNFVEIANECINTLQPMAISKNITFHKQIEHCEDITLFVDPVRLKQILLNLLDNAIKYNRKSGQVTISSIMEGNNLVIHIIDTGWGFSNDECEKIFHPFYRITHRKQQGAGIGLALVKQLVNLMGGKIGVQSSVGIGSVFSISFPVYDRGTEGASEKEVNTNIVKPALTNYTVLYIEDNESNLHLVNKVLASVGVNLLAANTGEDGIKLATRHKADLILLDINLHDTDGYQVFDRLKENDLTNDIPIIALSANAMEKDIKFALDKGFDDYLTKPINIKEFTEKICTKLGS